MPDLRSHPFRRHRLMPAHVPDELALFWWWSMDWALAEPVIRAKFSIETGNYWEPGLTAVERAIDRETGAERAFVEEFVGWVNEKVWGPMLEGRRDG